MAEGRAGRCFQNPSFRGLCLGDPSVTSLGCESTSLGQGLPKVERSRCKDTSSYYARIVIKWLQYGSMYDVSYHNTVGLTESAPTPMWLLWRLWAFELTAN